MTEPFVLIPLSSNRPERARQISPAHFLHLPLSCFCLKVLSESLTNCVNKDPPTRSLSVFFLLCLQAAGVIIQTILPP